jgi:hypothetical protein
VRGKIDNVLRIQAMQARLESVSDELTPPHDDIQHSTQKPQNSQNNTGLLCGLREFGVDRRG